VEIHIIGWKVYCLPHDGEIKYTKLPKSHISYCFYFKLGPDTLSISLLEKKNRVNAWGGELRGLSLRANYTDGEVSADFCAWCHVVSVTDPFGRILDF
jgi:hypothetical protein